MTRKIAPPAIAIFVCLMMAATSHAAQLRAGLARVEITPPAKGTPLSGYAARTSGSIGVLDPLYAKALVLDCEGKRIALVTMDIIQLPSERIPREAKEKFSVELVLLAASHTHFGPNFHSRRWPEPDGGKKAFQWTEDRVLEAIGQAADSSKMFPARLSLGRGEITLGYHRLTMQPNGRRRPLFRNPERIPYGPVDPTVSVIRVEDADAGTTRALLVGYAAHPVNLAHRCLLISADYPGAMMAKVEKALGPQALCMFVQGGGGSVNPFFIEEKTGEPDAITGHKKMGEFLADEALLAAKRATPLKGPNELQWRTETLTFHDRWSTTATVPIEMATVLINRIIGIAAVPGETFCSMQTMFKRDAPVEYPLFAGYTTTGGAEWPDYIPDIRAAAEGGYGADYSTHIEVGAAERIVNQAVIDLWWMKGMLASKPGK
jgi:hypothetical protein